MEAKRGQSIWPLPSLGRRGRPDEFKDRRLVSGGDTAQGQAELTWKMVRAPAEAYFEKILLKSLFGENFPKRDPGGTVRPAQRLSYQRMTDP